MKKFLGKGLGTIISLLISYLLYYGFENDIGYLVSGAQVWHWFWIVFGLFIGPVVLFGSFLTYGKEAKKMAKGLPKYNAVNYLTCFITLSVMIYCEFIVLPIFYLISSVLLVFCVYAARESLNKEVDKYKEYADK